jgi:hypothetical protein
MNEVATLVWALSPLLGFIGVCLAAMIAAGEW